MNSHHSQSKLCRDEPYCKSLNLNETICLKDDSILKACVASCTECQCEDDEIFCSKKRITPHLCLNDPNARRRCPKSCLLCKKGKNVNLFVYINSENFVCSLNFFVIKQDSPKTFFT